MFYDRKMVLLKYLKNAIVVFKMISSCLNIKIGLSVYIIDILK